MRSIQTKLIITIVSIAIIILIAAGIVLDRLFTKQLLSEFDKNLLQKTMTLVTLTTQNKIGDVEFDFADEFMPEFERKSSPEYFQLLLASGQLIERSRSLKGEDLPYNDIHNSKPYFSEITLKDGRQGRMIEVNFIPHRKDSENKNDNYLTQTASNSSKAKFIVAKGREELDQLLVLMRSIIISTIFLIIITLTAAIWIVVKNELAVLNKLASKMKNIDANRLNQRIDSFTNIKEVSPIVEQFNKMLGRIDESFQRERRFSGNVAHELRTPVSELKSIAEVGQEWPSDKNMIQKFFGSLVELADDMETTIENLMVLARCDNNHIEIMNSRVLLRELVESILSTHKSALKNNNVNVMNNVWAELATSTDREKIKLIINNLISNAIVYSPKGSTIIIDSHYEENNIAISFTNPTDNLETADLKLMFDRFWRKSSARTNHNAHAGLGLSLVKSLCTVLKAKVTAYFENEGKLTIKIEGLRLAA